MFESLYTYAEFGGIAIRVALGIIFLVHGFGKLKQPINWKILGVLEMIAALAVLSGMYTQLGAIFMVVVMLGAIYHKIFKWHTPFWSHNNTGWEFDFLILATAIALAVGVC